MKTTTVWKSGLVFDSQCPGHTIRLDAATESGRSDTGCNPKSLLLSALAGCTGMDVASLLVKMKVPFTSLVIDVEADQTEEHPKVFREIFMKYTIGSSSRHKEKIEKAIGLSYNKYCGVTAMLKKNGPVTISISILETA